MAVRCSPVIGSTALHSVTQVLGFPTLSAHAQNVLRRRRSGITTPMRHVGVAPVEHVSRRPADAEFTHMRIRLLS